jgi:hypothetical protein
LKRTYGTVDTGILIEKHDTYYIYDNYGNLTYVLPLKNGATTASITTINGQLNDLESIQIRPPQSPCGEKVTRENNGIYSL